MLLLNRTVPSCAFLRQVKSLAAANDFTSIRKILSILQDGEHS
jgi:hypothetical protein